MLLLFGCNSGICFALFNALSSKPGFIRFQPTHALFSSSLLYLLSTLTGESDRSFISNIDRGKAIIPFCDICVVQWYRPFLSSFAWDGFRVSDLFRSLCPALRFTEMESVSALGFLFDFHLPWLAFIIP